MHFMTCVKKQALHIKATVHINILIAFANVGKAVYML